MVMKLVPNEPKYWEFIRSLRSNPIIQTGFVDQVQISYEQQKDYMKKYNDNYYICINAFNSPIGFIGEIDDDIRIAVVLEAQRSGVGKFMVIELMKLRPDSYAKVKYDNIASKKLFECCGFTFVKKDDNFLYYEKK